jgi:hypothetical protein
MRRIEFTNPQHDRDIVALRTLGFAVEFGSSHGQPGKVLSPLSDVYFKDIVFH